MASPLRTLAGPWIGFSVTPWVQPLPCNQKHQVNCLPPSLLSLPWMLLHRLFLLTLNCDCSPWTLFSSYCVYSHRCSHPQSCIRPPSIIIHTVLISPSLFLDLYIQLYHLSLPGSPLPLKLHRFQTKLIITPFSSCFQSFPASWCFPISQLFASGGQSIGASELSKRFPQKWSIRGW